jgi:hypothetical protein
MMLTFSLSEVAGLLVAAVCLTSWFVPRLSKKANSIMDVTSFPQIVSDVSKLIADAKPLIAEVKLIVADVKSIVTDLTTLFPPKPAAIVADLNTLFPPTPKPAA